MEKHKNIPAGAIWYPEYKEWMLGEQNEAGEKTGIWEEWHIDGHLCGMVDYGNGQPPFPNKRFHPDGSLAQEGKWCGGQKWEGTYRWIKSENPTTELFPGGYAKESPNVWIAEFDYTEEGITYNARRYFDRQNNPVSVRGTPLPERPASVPERAYFVDKHDSLHILAHWAMSEIDPWKDICVGDYAEWDLNGNLLLKRVFNRNTGILVEEDIADVVPEQVINYYYPHIEPPVIRCSRHYSYNGNVRKEIFFDESGKLLCSIRNESITSHHKRWYYNDILVYEAIQTADRTKPPVSVRYFYPGGATLIDYISNGDGSGTWRLYDEAGRELLNMPRADEALVNELNRWGYYLPKSEQTTVATCWDAIAQNFREEHRRYFIEEKKNALPVPDFLQEELNKVDWENIEKAWGKNKELPAGINGLLSADEDVIAASTEHIWWSIECQGEVYAATYATATIIGRMLPFYKQEPVVEQRLLAFLYKVMTLPSLRRPGYYEMLSSLEFLIPELLLWARDADPVTARQAQHILIHVGKDSPETEVFLQQEWQHTEYSQIRRGYTLFCLGRFYELADENEKMEAHFSPAFLTETDPFLRIILAIFLVKASDDDAQDNWVAEIINTLVNPDVVMDGRFDSMQPFTGEDDTPEYLLKMLDYTNPAALTKNIGSIIMALPSFELYYQNTLLLAICCVLFGDEYATAQKKITPLRKNALLTLADLGEKDPDFLKHHSNMLLQYGLPDDAEQLRQLANSDC
ncbi:hypothetical protein SAMN05428988_4040 [Chitinophaga sp. YR573]|uniref:hypothetical protein n=1 Tax=Chitinophaga sp. YR573 TaxID=1881040 RepID=UPI0008CB1E24|nr:hypothetical protein [Chitinophaga sp. YR573]SEW29177.1 hypothetical protein SAMN05428988_4040 [Chitinophaga sp. YR573]